MNSSVASSHYLFESSRVSRIFPRRAFFVFVLLGVSVSGCGYNTIPTYEEQAKAKWADVQNQYQRRAVLIPNLVATVQGYAKQEKDVLTSVVEARAKATSVKIDASQLTDPDNRSAVDFNLRIQVLEEMTRTCSVPCVSACVEMLTNWRDGRLKLYLTKEALHFRRSHRDLFLRGEYLPLESPGDHRESVCS